jgi:hypothetical protein
LHMRTTAATAARRAACGAMAPAARARSVSTSQMLLR